MAKLSVKTDDLIANVGGAATAASALGCVQTLRDVFSEIGAASKTIGSAWNDPAQAIFIMNFNASKTQIDKHLSDLEGLLGRIGAAAVTFGQWDKDLYTKLCDPYLSE